LVILAKSSEVPSNGLCVRKGLSESIKNSLKTALLGIDADPEGKKVLSQFGAQKFIETTARDYQPVFDMAQKSGINVMSYKYSNK
jgi:ABC-type phosphate/phosphonate transport system substrate-binding protein